MFNLALMIYNILHLLKNFQYICSTIKQGRVDVTSIHYVIKSPRDQIIKHQLFHAR